MLSNTSKSASSPATEALEKLLSFKPKHVISKDKPMICTNNLKRSRCELAAFDMSAFEEASEHVEESIAFPSIEWSFDEPEEENEPLFSFPPSPKRRCSGLTRSSQASLDLSSFSGRNGSSGSLC